MTNRPDRTDTTPVQKAAMIVSILFLLIGIAGFIPGITSNFDDMKFAGHDSEAKLFGVFQTSVLHNLVHLAFGVVGLAMSRTWKAARTFLLAGGVIYLALFAYGMIVEKQDDANFVPLNRADDWLHLGLGIGMIALAMLSSRRQDTTYDNTGHRH
jgi:hypothetical protein